MFVRYFLKRFLPCAVLLAGCTAASEEFQQDADVLRLQHLEYYGNLLQEYKAQTGTYPLMGKANVPIYVHVASPQQVDDVQGAPPYAHKVIAFKEFIAEIEIVLGGNIEEYYDPQFEPDSKPNFYIYMVDGNTYNFAVHVHENFSFGNPVAKGYNKVEITNNTNGSSHLIKPEELFSSKEFNDAISRPLFKPEFFKDRENSFLHSTKS